MQKRKHWLRRNFCGKSFGFSMPIKSINIWTSDHESCNTIMQQCQTKWKCYIFIWSILFNLQWSMAYISQAISPSHIKWCVLHSSILGWFIQIDYGLYIIIINIANQIEELFIIFLNRNTYIQFLSVNYFDTPY